uniref:Putative phospholipase A1 magnifin n=1 Tax=Bactrocera latifrons TaxID=174628 RepID=A0A0K8UNL2_BACLA
MKLIFGLLGLFVSVALGGSSNFDETKGWFVPQADGSFSWISQSEHKERLLVAERTSVTVKFYLYHPLNRDGREVELNDASSLSAAGFNKKWPTRITIHGWTGDLNSSINVDVRNAFLETGNYNVFAVDWSVDAQTANYTSARYKVPSVGAVVANFVDFLSEHGMSFDSLGLVGHSMGAHVAGFTGKKVSRGKVHTIEGLDPALPLFNYDDCSSRLCSSDANYVETIQTDGGKVGFLRPIGKAAFYPNGGKNQPGCELDLTGSCSHLRAIPYYAEAITENNFPSMKCMDYEDAVDKSCGNIYSAVRMGAKSNFGISGTYYVPVKSSPPYGYGL